MSDIVERLKAEAVLFRGNPDCVGPAVTLLTEEAADTIATLRTEVERLKARDAEWLDVGTDAHGVITRMKAELTTLRAEVEKLRAVLRALHDEMDEYQRINNLSAYNNHVMRQARAALAQEGEG